MAIAFVQKKSNRASGTSINAVFDNPVAAGSLLVAAVSGVFVNSETLTVTDNNGNVWTRIRQALVPNTVFPANPARHELWYAKNANAGATTVNLASTSGGNHAIVVQEFSGVDQVNALDKQNSNVASSGTAMTAGSTGTLSKADELIVASGALGLSNTITAGGTYSNLEQTAAGVSAAIQSKIVTATTAQNPDMTAGASQPWAMIVATFREAPIPANSERAARLTGYPNGVDSRAASMAGSELADSERTATMVGYPNATDERAGVIDGKAYTNDERSAVLRGVLATLPTKQYMYKVYRRERGIVTQGVYDGDFEGLSDDNFTTYWEGVGTPANAMRNRLQAYPEQVPGEAIQLNGVNNGVYLPTIGQIGFQTPTVSIGNDFTIVLEWYKANWDDGLTEYFLHDKDNLIGNSGLELSANVSAGNLRASICINGTYRNADYALTNIGPGLHQLAIQASNGNVRLYVDGVNVASNTAGSGGSSAMNGFQSMQLGFRDRWNVPTLDGWATGTVDSVSVYTNDLSAAQLLQMFTGKNPIRADLVAHWDLDNIDGATLNDEVNNIGAFAIGSPTWVAGYAGKLRSAMVITDTGGSSEQGLQQPSSARSIIIGGEDYTAHARVMAAIGEQINLTVTPQGGGSPQTVSITANGQWQQIVNTYTTDVNADELAIQITISDADASIKQLFIDKVALNIGLVPFDYFDENSVGEGSTVYSFDEDTQSHTVTTSSYTFIDVWRDVTSDFSYPQEINSNGSEVPVELSRAYPNYGEGTDVDFGLEVRVFMITDEHINGIPMFVGYISDYDINEDDETLTVKLFSYGAELSNYLLAMGNTVFASMPAYPTYRQPTGFWSDTVWAWKLNITERTILSAVRLKLALASAGSVPITLRIYSGDPELNSVVVISGSPSYDIDPSNQFVASSTDTQTVDDTAIEVYEWAFDDVVLQPGEYYIDTDFIDFAAILRVYGSDASGLASVDGWPPIGRAYSARATVNNAGFGFSPNDTNPQSYMELLTNNGTNTTVEFLSEDPMAIVRMGMANYQSQGGNLGFDDISLPLTNTVVSYPFKAATIADVVKKALELMPAGWYYYIDHAENKLVFRRKSDTAQHTFIIGKHIRSLKFEKRTRDIVNTIYFTGGELSPGVNFFKKYVNQASVDTYGVRLQNYTDNRVKREDTADTIANRILESKGGPEIKTTPSVIDYETEAIKPGDMVTFRGDESTPGELSLFDVGEFDEAYFDYNPSVPSTLTLQIARFGYSPEKADMTLSTAPTDVNKRIEDINRNLQKQETLNNPDEPS